jgi:hypothetical protein
VACDHERGALGPDHGLIAIGPVNAVDGEIVAMFECPEPQ